MRRVTELAGSQAVEYECEYKLDGLSMALHYEAADEDGHGAARFVRGITRGDGTIGRRCDGEFAHDPVDSAPGERRAVAAGRADASV